MNSTVFNLQDLISTIGESAALRTVGIVIWGDMNLTSSKVRLYLRGVVTII